MRRTEVSNNAVPKLKVTGKISDITINLTPYTYSHLVNISRLFYPASTKGEANPMSFA